MWLSPTAMSTPLLIGGLAAIGGCASASGGGGTGDAATYGAGAMPPPCEAPAADGPGPASFNALVDSAAFVADVRERWDPSWGRITATLTTMEDGEGAETPEGVIVYPGVPEEGLTWIRERLLEHRTTEPLPRDRVSLLIADDGRLAPRTIQGLRSCGPGLAPGEQERFTRSLQALRSRFLDELRAGSLRVQLWIRVEETGRAGEIRIMEQSRSRDFDRVAVRLTRTVRFTPAWVEGRAVPVWLDFPVTMIAR